MFNRRNLCYIVVLVTGSFLLGACSGPTTRQVEINELLVAPEEKPYPVMDAFRLEGVPFGFFLCLTQRPFFADEIPHFIDVNDTVFRNVSVPEGGNAERIRSVLQSLCLGRASAISLNGGYANSLHLQSRVEQTGKQPAIRSVTYFMELSLELELISFKKENRISRAYLARQGQDFESLAADLLNYYGQPHYAHTKINSSGKHKHFWWGVDDRTLVSINGYDYLNASHWKNFRGKTFHIAVWEKRNGDVLIEETMRDNYRGFLNEYSEPKI